MEWVLLKLTVINHTLDLLIEKLSVAIKYCKVDGIRSDTDKHRKNYYYASLGGGLRASDKVEAIAILKDTPLYRQWIDV